MRNDIDSFEFIREIKSGEYIDVLKLALQMGYDEGKLDMKEGVYFNYHDKEKYLLQALGALYSSVNEKINNEKINNEKINNEKINNEKINNEKTNNEKTNNVITLVQSNRKP